MFDRRAVLEPSHPELPLLGGNTPKSNTKHGYISPVTQSYITRQGIPSTGGSV